ncbi:MAG: ATP-binding protein, partial [bacterium]
RVLLEEKRGTIELTVEDNGRGIADQDIANPASFGILGIRERARSMGGDLNINAVPGGGTSIVIQIPFENR